MGKGLTCLPVPCLFTVITADSPWALLLSGLRHSLAVAFKSLDMNVLAKGRLGIGCQGHAGA